MPAGTALSVDYTAKDQHNPGPAFGTLPRSAFNVLIL
jgi:hypothetical protein